MSVPHELRLEIRITASKYRDKERGDPQACRHTSAAALMRDENSGATEGSWGPRVQTTGEPFATK